MRKVVKTVLVLGLFLLLVLIRAYGTKLFYDPFIQYFVNEYLARTMPEYDALKLFASLFFRYFLNTVVSLAIIYLCFERKPLVVFSVKFYSIAFVVLCVAYFFLLQVGFQNGHLLGFYVRRFLIHPIFLLILLPAFYYQRKLVGDSLKW